jgi:uncharacterized membrane protein YhhN
MFEIPYLIAFVFFAVLFIVIKAIKANELQFNNQIVNSLLPYSTGVKIIPAGLAIIFVLVNQHESVFLSLFLSLGLLFCLLGDAGMEKGLIPGLPLFLVAQILLIVTFVGESLTIGISTEAFIITGLVTIAVAGYDVFFIRYLETSEEGLGEFRIPVIIYCVFLSGMFLSTLLLWTSSNTQEFGLVVLGGLLFVISDSIIAIREFHHPITNNIIKVMSTYYSAIFLLSLSSIMQFA